MSHTPTSHLQDENPITLVHRMTQSAIRWIRHKRLAQKWSTAYPYAFKDNHLLSWPEAWVYLAQHGNDQGMYRDITWKCNVKEHTAIVNAITAALDAAPSSEKGTIQANAKTWLTYNPLWKIDVANRQAIENETTFAIEMGCSPQDYRPSWFTKETPIDHWTRRMTLACNEQGSLRPLQNIMQNAKEELTSGQYAMLILETRIDVTNEPYKERSTLNPAAMQHLDHEWNALSKKNQQEATVFVWLTYLQEYKRVYQRLAKKGAYRTNTTCDDYEEYRDYVYSEYQSKEYALRECSPFANELEDVAKNMLGASTTNDLTSSLSGEHLELVNLNSLKVQEAFGIQWSLTRAGYWNMQSFQSTLYGMDLHGLVDSSPEEKLF